MTLFSLLLSGMVHEDRGSSVVVPPDWMQGRSTFGGLTAALCVAAARERVTDPPPLRSAQFAFTGPVGGKVSFENELLRRGGSSVFMGVDVVCEQRLSARALLLFAAGRDSVHRHVPRGMPDVAPPEDCPDFFGQPGAPQFTRHFEARLALGSPILSGATDLSFHVWMRHRGDSLTAEPPMARLLALSDALPPPVLALPVAFAPVSTMTWSIDVVLPDDGRDDLLDGQGWHLLSSRSDAVADGYSSQEMNVWRADGTRILAGRQVVAAFF